VHVFFEQSGAGRTLPGGQSGVAGKRLRATMFAR
jgi:hypothetical protein